MEAYCFDAGVFLTPLLRNRAPEVVAECGAWVARIERGEVDACTSCLTWDEVTWVAGRAGAGRFDVARATEAGRRFLALPNLRFVPAEDGVIRAAQDIMARTRVRPRDSIHAATALRYAAGNLVTVDSDFVTSSAPGLVSGLHVVLVPA
jgi:predicted nucleic acid-binding protein